MVSVSSALGEIDGAADALADLAGQPDDEIAVDQQAQLLAVRGEALRHVDGGALLDVLEDLRVARFVADDQQPAAGLLHGLQGVVIGGDARRAGPGEVERLQLLAELDGALLAVVEGVVVEEDFLHAGETARARSGTSLATSSAERRRQRWPECVCGHRQKVHMRRAAARGVERNERIQQERDVVARDVQIALVDLGDPGQRVQVLDGRAFGVVDDLRRSCGS